MASEACYSDGVDDEVAVGDDESFKAFTPGSNNLVALSDAYLPTYHVIIILSSPKSINISYQGTNHFIRVQTGFYRKVSSLNSL